VSGVFNMDAKIEAIHAGFQAAWHRQKSDAAAQEVYV